MKKSLLFLGALALAASSYGQMVEDTTKAYDEWRKRYRAQKTIATSAAVAGGAMMLVGGVMYLTQFESGWSFGWDEQTAKTGSALFLSGLGIAVASSVFLQPSQKHGRQPAQPFVAMEKAPQPQPGGINQRSYPSWGLRVRL